MDGTAAQRQKKRLDRLKEQGIGRASVLVHESCKPALEALRPMFADPAQAKELMAAVKAILKKSAPVNVSEVQHLSPFRYPGGKTWLVPEVKKWVQSGPRPQLFIEPFAGGAMAGLSVAADNLADQVILCELDEDVAAVWDTIFNGTDEDVEWLKDSITGFAVNLDGVKAVLSGNPQTTREKAFRTIIKNRMQRGGIMAAGAGLIKEGEGGKGLLSRWYPETLANRISGLRALQARVRFVHGNAFDVIRQHAANPNAYFFVDPPYTAGGKKAGTRLYTHNEIDHPGLFSAIRETQGQFMLTYDDADEVRRLAEEHGFTVAKIPMKSTHHKVIHELLVKRQTTNPQGDPANLQAEPVNPQGELIV